MFKRRKFHPKDKVVYIGNESNMIYYPPKNTKGTIVKTYNDEGYADVSWDNGTESGSFSCDYKDLKLDNSCPYCGIRYEYLINKKDIKIRIHNNKLEVRNENNAHTLKIRYCSFCGRKL